MDGDAMSNRTLHYDLSGYALVGGRKLTDKEFEEISGRMENYLEDLLGQVDDGVLLITRGEDREEEGT